MRVCTILYLLALQFVWAGDWPQFLGPHRNGSTDEMIAGNWEAKEPKVLWSKPVGSGFAGPIVVGGDAILFHREGSSEILSCFDSATGRPKWQQKAPTDYRDDFGFDEGPRSTPCVAEGRVYAMGAEGLVRCVSLADGKLIWTLNTKKELNARKGFFGMACSPLVHGSNVLLSVGGTGGAGIVALDKDSGELRWKALNHEAGYASPILAKLDGKERAIFFTREGLAVLDPVSGKLISERAWRAPMDASVNAASPVLIGENIFATTSYNTGAILARLTDGELKPIWSGDDSLSSHYATPVHHEGYLYGFHGRQEMGPGFRCIETKTGKVAWDQPSFGGGSVTLAGTHLLILKETGELILAPASPARFQVNGRVHLLGSDTRAFPAISNKRHFARDKRNLICAEIP
jgi:outer membrane protein assembly factor BamB